MSSAPWEGVFPALVTPLTDAGALDRPALRRVIDWTMSHGVHGLSVVGSTGEGALLNGKSDVRNTDDPVQ